MSIRNFPQNPKITLRKPPDEFKDTKNRCKEGVALYTAEQNLCFLLGPGRPRWLPKFQTKSGIFLFFGFRPRKISPQIFWRGGIPVILCGNASEELFKKLVGTRFFIFGLVFGIFRAGDTKIPQNHSNHPSWGPGAWISSKITGFMVFCSLPLEKYRKRARK